MKTREKTKQVPFQGCYSGDHPLFDVVQYFHTMQKTGCLRVFNQHAGFGFILFEAGEIRSVVNEKTNCSGERILWQMLDYRSGQFEFYPIHHTIGRRTSEILLNWAGARDVRGVFDSGDSQVWDHPISADWRAKRKSTTKLPIRAPDVGNAS